MALFKPSNFYPNLEEIDLNEENVFSCQINSSGNSVKAYKIWFLTEDNDDIFSSEATILDIPIKNKKFLNINNLKTLDGYEKLKNGNNYKWNIRVYDALVGSEAQPDTLICSGFIVGSTQNVIWTNNNDKLEYDRWIEFKTTGPSSMMPILKSVDEDLELPQEEEEFVERRKIDWVIKELGYEKNITKIETTEPFTYNYINDTKFSIYQCSDQHTYNSVFVDPNDMIELGMKIEIYNGDSVVESQRKIIGYSEDTGEIRVQEAFSSIPKNGYTYKIYKKTDISGDSYQEVEFTSSNKIGGEAIEDDSFKVITNICTPEKKVLFIQPNINIKSDDTNPNEIVFDNGVRVDITKKMNGEKDITIDRLDDSQWIITSPTSSTDFPIIPRTKYKVYSDFMDSMPENIFYAKDSPIITIQCKNDNIDSEEYQNITDGEYKSFRDIKFNSIWESKQNVQIKNYQYFLYDKNMNLISNSPVTYEEEIIWIFRGLDTSRSEANPNIYYIKLVIEDEYGKVFEKQEMFKVYYYIEETILPLIVENNCEKEAFDISFTVPIEVLSTDAENFKSVQFENVDLNTDILDIPYKRIANYTKINSIEETYITIPKDFSFLASFQLEEEFMKEIPNGEDNMKKILEIGCENESGGIDYYSLKLGNFDRYYVYQDENLNSKVIINPNQFKLKLYKNDSKIPISCFNQGTQDYFDLSQTQEGKELLFSSKLAYALQDNRNNDYVIQEVLPNVGDSFKKYILTKDYFIRDILYSKGIYLYKNGRWIKDYSTEYIFLDKISSLEEEIEVKIPENCLETDGDTIKFIDENNVFVESNNIIDNIYIISKKWFIFYLNIYNGNIIADIELNEGRK